jgi:hypothetical protein
VPQQAIDDNMAADRDSSKQLLQLIEAYLRLLEDLVGMEVLVSSKHSGSHHPARVDYSSGRNFCARLTDRNYRVTVNDNPTALIELTRRAFAVIHAFGGADDASLCKFANYGDAAVHRRLCQVARDPFQFLDVLAEIKTAGLFVSSKCEVTAFESADMPDLLVILPSGLELLVECKRVDPASKARAICDQISRANTQIKRANRNCPGIVALDISSIVRDARGVSDFTPPEVHRAARTMAGAIATHNSSVSAVALLWESMSLFATPFHRVVSIHGTYSSRLYRHRKPRVPLAETLRFPALAMTVLYQIVRDDDGLVWSVPDWAIFYEDALDCSVMVVFSNETVLMRIDFP